MAFAGVALAESETAPRARSEAGSAERAVVKELPIQAPSITFLGPLQTRTPWEIPGFGAVEGIHLGKVTLRPSYDLKLTYDDNIFGQEKGGAKRDLILRNSPGIELDYTISESINLKTAYTFGWTDYLDDTARDYLTHNQSLNLEWKNAGVPGLDLALNEQYHQSGNTAVLEDEFVSFTRVQGISAGPTISFRRGRMGFIAGYQLGVTDYFGRTSSEGDFHSHATKGLFFYQVSGGIVPYIFHEFTGTRFAHSAEDDFDLHDLRAGARFTEGSFKFDFNLGNRRSLAREGYDSSDGLATRLRVDYVPNERWSLFFNAARHYDAGVRTGSSTNLEFSAGGGVELLRRLRLDSMVLWLESDRTSGTLQRTAQFDLRLTGKMAKHLTGYLAFIRLERTSNRFRDIIINRLEFGLQARF